MEQVKITIKIQSPTLIANTSTAGVLTSTRGSIDGRILRGIFANHFIKSHNLGKEAHKNQSFMDLFYGGLRFVSAYKDTVKGTSFPAPLSLQKFKNADKKIGFRDGDIIDSYYAKEEFENEAKQNLLGFKGVKGFVVLEADKCYPVSIETAIKLHMSRSSDDERKMGRSKDGNIFNYEYLEPNQVFVGTIVGSKTVLESFVREFPTVMECYIGRSRYTEYGRCSVEIGDIETINSNIIYNNSKDNKYTYIRFHTPVIIGNQSLKEIVESTIQPILGPDVYVYSMCAAYQEEQNFNSIWGIRSPSEPAASAGTVIQLKKDTGWLNTDIKQLEQICYSGIGSRIQEGYGQCRLWLPNQFILSKFDEIGHDDIGEINIESQTLIQQILEKQIVIEARLCAAKDVAERLNKYDSSHHFASVLLDEVGNTREYGIGKLRTFIKHVMKEKKILYKTLRNVYIRQQYSIEHTGSQNLMQYIDTFDESVLLRKCIENTKNMKLEILIKKSGMDKKRLSYIVSYEYWHYFLRHVRKQTGKGGAVIC